MSILRSSKSWRCSRLKSLPTAATMLTGEKKRAASAKKLAEPPNASIAPPCCVSTVSYAIVPTTTMLMRYLRDDSREELLLDILPDYRAKVFDNRGRNRGAVRDNATLARIAARARAPPTRQRARDVGDRALRRRHVEPHHTQDFADIHGLHALMPAVVVRHQREHRVAQFGLAGEPRLLHRRH